MKKLFTYVLMLCASLSVSVAQQIQYPEPILNPESCTSIMDGYRTFRLVRSRYDNHGLYRTYAYRIRRGNPGDDRERNAARSAVYVSIPQHRLSLPQREAVGYRRDNDHRPESPCQQERYVHDRGTSANRLATLHDRP